MSGPTSRQPGQQPEQAAGPPRGARPLSREDLAILALEDATVAGHTCKVVLLDGEIELTALRASVASRLDQAPELCLRLDQVAGSPWWVPDPHLDVRAQIVLADSPAPEDDAGLRAVVAHVFRQHLDRSRPLWRMDLVPLRPGGGSAVIWRIHHALADGSTCMRLAREVLWDTSPGREDVGRAPDGSARAAPRPGPGARTPDPGGSTGRARVPRIASRWPARLRAAGRQLPQPWRASPFDGPVGRRRSVAFATASLAGLHRAAAADGATVNDAVLSVIAGGLRRWLELNHARVAPVRVKVPVSLHGAGEQAGNRDSFFCLDLPLGPATSRERLAAARHATMIRKQGEDAQLLDSLLARLASRPRLSRLADRLLASPASFGLNVSNVHGPLEPVAVLGAPVTSLFTLAEIRGRHALRISVVSLAGTLRFGFVADPALVPDVDRLAAGVQAEAEALTSS
jgi:diacylglycerol O-acyltransferase / wax synthase